MNGYERRTESKKERIRAAALEFFSSYGTEKTSVNEVAERAGVSPATIYNYFGSKEGLMKETIIGVLEAGWKAKIELWETDAPFPDLIRRAISMSEDFLDRTNLAAIKELFESGPEIKKLVEDFNRNRYPAVVERFLAKGRAEGYIRNEISVEAATVYLKMYQDALAQSGMLDNQNKAVIMELVDLMLYGLAGPALPVGRRAGPRG